MTFCNLAIYNDTLHRSDFDQFILPNLTFTELRNVSIEHLRRMWQAKAVDVKLIRSFVIPSVFNLADIF